MAAKKVAAPIINGSVAMKLRDKLKLNQATFWGRLGVTQSGGCRYEGGRTMPRPVKRLYFLTYVVGVAGAPALMPKDCALYDAIK